MEEFDVVQVARKSVKGIVALVSRTFFFQVLTVITNLILTIYLEPATFGIFFLVSSIIVFFNYFQDVGLAASLIQKKEEPTLKELRTVFSVQQILVLLFIIPGFFASSYIADFFKLNSDGLLLFQVFLVSFFLTSLRTIPTVLLERKLAFEKLVVPQIIENVIYNVTLVLLVLMGYEITSFTIAIFLRSIIGLIIIYFIQPWNLGLDFSMPLIKRLMKFGIPFQVNGLLALVKDDLLNIYIAKILAFNQVGYIGFAQKWAFLPLRLIMDNVIKVTFPSFSRLQDDREALKKLVEKSLFLISLTIFPIFTIIITMSPYFIDFVPRYEKWEPAVISLIFFSLNGAFASVLVPLTNFLNAIGKIKVTLYFMVFWTILTWTLTPLMISYFGYNGVSIASFLVVASSISIVFFVKKYLDFSFVKPIWKQLIASFVMLAFLYFSQGLITSFMMLFVIITLSTVVYCAFIMLIARDEITKTFNFVAKTIRKEE